MDDFSFIMHVTGRTLNHEHGPARLSPTPSRLRQVFKNISSSVYFNTFLKE